MDDWKFIETVAQLGREINRGRVRFWQQKNRDHYNAWQRKNYAKKSSAFAKLEAAIMNDKDYEGTRWFSLNGRRSMVIDRVRNGIAFCRHNGERRVGEAFQLPLGLIVNFKLGWRQDKLKAREK